MTDRTCLSIVLAAGEGTRMKSHLPKVLHPIAGLPLVSHVVKAVQGTGKSDVALVVGRGAEEVRGAVEKVTDAVSAFEQKERLGTAHAVLAAREAIKHGYDDLLIVFGDTPLIEAHSLQAARNKLAEGADVVVIGFRPASPHGYGRLLEEGGKLTAIIEEKEASEAQKKIGFCNGGLMAVRGSHALALLDAVDNKNAKGEYYLTDIVGLAHGKGLNVVAIEVPVDNVIGINNRAELAEAENIWQNRKRQEMMLAGVTLIAPETVFFSHDTLIEADVVIEPNVFFGQGVQVASGALIHAFSHIEGAKIGVSAEIGPFARLRPGANLGEKSKVGNFCEVKNAHVGKGAKINHLTYIGDATVGASSNIGAGTITCNYDGYNKYKTVIGENAFIGSNSSLVAPLSIGDNAYIASGSTITDDVPADALAFGRARQETKEGRGKILREKYAAIKAAKISSK
ncbi:MULTISPECIES: bifunctional UDP-N-acetylglucosamine diphosphorylase/glucosamine-1-phosphate N-acetyltransferase GlmU [Brucella/Ochrobactrum group]|jgi:bifunctional UDP-N-acetylglucosamine pyrophosphorylase/glucosamine-1-phosphate N-acetyltransferase|uniref:bifunctional UDP-N-acetylglucosamine diphosphorylase/glucosamine-1-phosphate N-acetyltransferase GlmU n=1 Tax=Brucella/Ochrobactrum group TaxID=2826938 RepID=UPI001C05DDD1|nr:bifunctional UDP-N-acetylglucosamine diphosphorylase/glucosamine-1-phosphate N-acetyltransferase GlmU [Brucella sp. NBRC 12950]QWK80011.1 bifunctional UDP-N-acetylglucosamine diphosphorylase/glucosamine-1-phosphate N-acetyltransferase GlmU [Ochrobactrum sp. BTU1]GLU27103.1 bifunctional protein GlmU [Brucella sp. NBRC 12950]